MKPRRNRCRICGCTPKRACTGIVSRMGGQTIRGTCWWVDERGTLCSACVDELLRRLDGEVVDGFERVGAHVASADKVRRSEKGAMTHGH